MDPESQSALEMMEKDWLWLFDFAEEHARKFSVAVMFVMREVIHLEVERMIALVDERRGKTMMEEILKGGNFGKFSGLTDHGMAAKYFLKIKRNMRFVSLYLAEALCEPVFRTWHFFWRIINR